MKYWWLVRAGILSVTIGTAATAQPIDPALQHVNRYPESVKTERKPKIPYASKISSTPPSSSASTAAPLSLRGGAVPTGLGGFYDYQSNGNSPGYLYIRPGEWDKVHTTFMNSLSGGNADEVSGTRRVGYAYSSNGGSSWISNRAIVESRLGFPALAVTSDGMPVIAVHGDIGSGEQVLLYSSPGAADIQSFFLVTPMPLETSAGKESGVIWPQIAVSSDDSRAILLGSYNNDADAKEPISPLQSVSVDINSGEIPERWSSVSDSISSLTSGGRAILARSPSGKLGAAWYRLPTDSNDTEDGIYFAESTDDGRTWGPATAVLKGEALIQDFNINGDVDTISSGANLDMTYLGEEAQIVFTGNMNGLLQFGNILYWSPSKNLKMIVLSHQAPGLGAYGIPLDHRQSNMGSLAYPTISTGDDGQHIVVGFSAVSQTLNEAGDAYTSVISDLDYLYYRVWGVGSPDGGESWGRPFIIQDFAGEGSDSASIEYPVANEVGHVENGSFELPISFMARRYPGLYTGMQDDQIAGPITETLQYFQRFTVTPNMFTNVSSAPESNPAAAESFSVRLLPNITSGPTSVMVTLPSGGRVDVRVYTLLGEEVASATRAGQRGVETIPLDLGNLASGAYYCTVTRNGKTASARIVVAR